jgi:hypothetical protein
VLNSLEALGLIPSADADTLSDDEGRIVALWGDDPVHPTRAAYRELAAKIAEKTALILEEKPESESGFSQKKRKIERRDPWISGSSSVAKRLDARMESSKNLINKGVKAPHRPYRGRGWWARGTGRGYGRGKKSH